MRAQLDPPVSRVDGPTTMPSDECGWWETERAALVKDRLHRLAPPGGRLLDVGCGRGGMLDDPRFHGRLVVRVDSHRWAEWSSHDEQRVFVQASAGALPFRDGAFDVVGSFDVLEHLPDDEVALAEQSRVVDPAGAVVIAVPADDRLWSQHDEAVGHLRRYDRATLRRLVRRAGLETQRCTHFFSFLWLPAYLTRRLRLRTSEPGNTPSLTGRLIRLVIRAVAQFERWLIARWSLPLGTSLWVETRPAKPDGAGELAPPDRG